VLWKRHGKEFKKLGVQTPSQRLPVQLGTVTGSDVAPIAKIPFKILASDLEPESLALTRGYENLRAECYGQPAKPVKASQTSGPALPSRHRKENQPTTG